MGSVPHLAPAPARIPYLDGLRGLAVLLVVCLHFLHHGFYPAVYPGSWYVPLHHVFGLGWIGVDLFFVLSGFLLGGILLDHRGAPNFFAIFYARRAARILPVYFVFLLPLFIVPFSGLGRRIPALERFVDTGAIPAWTYPLFLQNIAMPLQASWGEAWISTTWSLAVEEQFYLLLPLLVRFVPAARLPRVLIALIAVSPLVRLASFGLEDPIREEVSAYVLLPARWDSLFTGVLAAWAVRDENGRHWLSRRARLLRTALAVALAVTMAFAILAPSLHDPFARTVGPSIFALLFASAILCGHFGFLPGARWFEGSVLRFFGRISYALYLFHIPVSCVVFYALVGRARSLQNATDVALIALSFVLSVAVATLSWRWFERPILAWAQRWRYAPAGSPALPGRQ
jgi:peptidoglycan/LPS O-acetylase OafA/YrhL